MFLILPFNLQFIFLLKFSDKNFNIYTLLFFIAGFILVAVDFPYQDHRLLWGFKSIFTNLKLYGACCLTISFLILFFHIAKIALIARLDKNDIILKKCFYWEALKVPIILTNE